MDFKKMGEGIARDAEKDIAQDLNLNTVSEEVLAKVPGIGEQRAHRIVESRPFNDWLDLQNKVPGISDKLIETLQQHGATVS